MTLQPRFKPGIIELKLLLIGHRRHFHQFKASDGLLSSIRWWASGITPKITPKAFLPVIINERGQKPPSAVAALAARSRHLLAGRPCRVVMRVLAVLLGFFAILLFREGLKPLAVI